MQQINGYIVYMIGVSLAELSVHVRPGSTSTFADALASTLNARQRLDEFVADYRVPLRGSKDRARNIIAWLDMIQTGASATPQEPIPINLSSGLFQELFAFQYVFQTECARLPLYLVTEKRGWDMTILTEHAEFTLASVAWSALSADEKSDIQAAGRCFAFEVPTAAAFHLYRLLESFVLKYIPLFGVALKDSDRNLGNYIKLLVASGVDKKITDLLQHIKDEYRNPAIHPGLFFGVDGAATQFALVQSVIQMIADDILDRLGPTLVWPSDVMEKHFAWKRA